MMYSLFDEYVQEAYNSAVAENKKQLNRAGIFMLESFGDEYCGQVTEHFSTIADTAQATINSISCEETDTSTEEALKKILYKIFVKAEEGKVATAYMSMAIYGLVHESYPEEPSLLSILEGS